MREAWRRIASSASFAVALLVLASYIAPASVPVIAWGAHQAYHLSERLRAQQELAQRRAIEAILAPSDHGASETASHVHTGAGPSLGASYAHGDPTILHRHSEGGELHSHPAPVDRLLAAAQGDTGHTVGAPTPTVLRVGVHVPAPITELPGSRLIAKLARSHELTTPMTTPRRLPDPPPRA